jgi:hypothetical protein
MGQAKGNAGKGRLKNVPNKISRDLKAMIEDALIEVGGKDYFVAQAAASPTAFLAIVGKLLPKDVNVDVRVGLAEMVLNSMREREEKP